MISRTDQFWVEIGEGVGERGRRPFSLISPQPQQNRRQNLEYAGATCD